jgi:hypothetical protein
LTDIIGARHNLPSRNRKALTVICGSNERTLRFYATLTADRSNASLKPWKSRPNFRRRQNPPHVLIGSIHLIGSWLDHGTLESSCYYVSAALQQPLLLSWLNQRSLSFRNSRLSAQVPRCSDRAFLPYFLGLRRLQFKCGKGVGRSAVTQHQKTNGSRISGFESDCGSHSQ